MGFFNSITIWFNYVGGCKNNPVLIPLSSISRSSKVGLIGRHKISLERVLKCLQKSFKIRKIIVNNVCPINVILSIIFIIKKVLHALKRSNISLNHSFFHSFIVQVRKYLTCSLSLVEIHVRSKKSRNNLAQAKIISDMSRAGYLLILQYGIDSELPSTIFNSKTIIVTSKWNKHQAIVASFLWIWVIPSLNPGLGILENSIKKIYRRF